MKKIAFTIITGISVSLTSYAQVDPYRSFDEGKLEGNIYTSLEIGWTIEIPKGWTVIDKEKSEEIYERGREALKGTFDGEIGHGGMKDLISFRKSQFNIFQSVSEPFELDYEGEWEENNSAIKEILYLALENQGIKADSSSTKIEKIDGLDFHTYSFTIYGLNGEVLLKQIMYNKLINGLDFGVNINYNNDQDADQLLKAFRNSKFRK